MPVVARALNGVRAYGLAFSLFLTMLVLGVVVAGSWSDARGPAGSVWAGLVLFASGLVISGLAPSFPVLLVGRALAGAGGGLLVVALYVVVAALVPRAEQPRIFGYISAGWVLPSLVGPAVAGWLASEVSWRAVFLLVPPLVAAPAAVLLPRLRRLPAPAGADGGARRSIADPHRVLRGVGLAGGVVVLQLGLQGAGRASGPAVAAAGALAMAVTLPGLLPPGTLRLARGLPTVVALRGMYAAAFFGAETFVPLMLVTQRDLAPAAAGLTLTGGAVGWATGSWLQGRTWFRVPRHLLLAGGGLIVGVSLWTFTVLTWPRVPVLVGYPLWTVAGLGMGLAMSSTSVLVLRLSAPGEEGRNSAGLQISDALGSVLGIGAAGAVFAALHDPGGSDAEVFRLIWAGLGVVGVLSAAVALRARQP
jgi:MFS family permease